MTELPQIDLSELKVGYEIVVSFGSKGTQRAKVTHAARSGKHGVYIKASKFVKKSNRWTPPIQVYAGEVIAIASRRGAAC